jgi:ankyrin repeat protein
LELLKNDDIEDFSISSNNAKFGDFDDVVLEIKYKNQDPQTYAFQLKHANKKGPLTVAGLTGESGNFSIKKYIKGFKFVNDSVKVILFTNKLFDGSENQRIKFGWETIIVHESPQDSLLTTSDKGHSYNFTVENPKNLPETTVKFFNNFLLYTNQMHVEKLEESTQNKFKDMFSCDESVFKEYIYFVINWSLTDGKKKKLEKTWVKRAIAIQLLSRFIKPLWFDSDPVNENTRLLRETMSRIRITIFDRKNRREVTILWKDFKNEINDLVLLNEIRKQYQIRMSRIESVDDLQRKELSKLLWLMGKCPLVLDGRGNISAALDLCPDDKFVILSPNFPIDFSSSFQNLSDLQDEPDMFQNFLNNFTYSLPCAETVNLTDLDVEIDEIKDVTTNELVVMTHSDSLEDKEGESLPPCYVKRNLTKTMIDPTFLNQIYTNTLILISCIENVDSFKLRFKYIKFVKLKEFSNDNCNDIVTYVTDGEYSQEEFDELCRKRSPDTDCHQFRYVNDNCLEWIRSKNSIEKLRKYLLIDDNLAKYDNYVISETELFDSPSTNHVNIICANPGMGKSTLMKNLKNDAPPTVLRILVYARNHALYFRKKDADAEAFLDYILHETHKKDENFNKRILKILKTRGRLEFIWDGLDEISEKNLVVVKQIIKNVSKKGHRQWLTSRNNLKTALETELNVFSKTLTQFDVSEQRTYVGNRLELYGDDLVEIFKIIKKNILHFPNNNILGIPLQIFMLTELFLRDDKKYSHLLNLTFSAADLYQHFVDQKFKIHFKEKEHLDDKIDAIYATTNFTKTSVIDDYKRVAAATYLSNDLVGNLDCQEFLKNIQNDKDPFGFITYVSDALTPEFCHNSFGEYFAALYVSESSSEIFQNDEFMYNEEYNNIRFFFDLIVSENNIAHIAVLYNNFKLLEECNEEELICRDKIGRTAFDLALSRRRKYPILQTSKTSNGYYIYYWNVKLAQFKDVAFQKILDFLSGYNGSRQNSLIFDNNFLLLPFIALSDEDKSIISRSGTKLLLNLLFYAIQIDYSNIFAQFGNLPFIKTDYRETLLHLAISNESINSLECILYNEKYRNYLIENTKLLSTMCNFKFAKILNLHKINLNVGDSDKNTPLHHACESNNLEAISFLIQSGAKLNVKNKKGETPLHCALDCSSLEVMQLLIQNGADVNVRDKSGKTVLHCASEIKDFSPEILELLIENNADLNIVDTNGQSPIHYACLKGSADTLKFLIQNGADVNLTNKADKTPLHFVCDDQHISDEIVTILIKSGAQLDAVDKTGRAPIHCACQKGFSEKVKLLVKHGARVNLGDRKRKTALHYCCHNKKISGDVLKLVIRKSADKDITDKSGYAAIHYACMNASLEKLKLLIRKGASVNITDSRGQTVLHYACQHKFISPYFMNILIENNADLNVVDESSRTPLHYACLNGFRQKVKLLLIQNGVRVYIPDEFGRTPLLYACENPKISSDCVETLIKNKAKLDIIDKADRTAIHYACASACVEKLKLLIQNGADVNIKNSTSSTPLHFVCERSSIPHSVLEVLIENKANLNVFDKDHLFPIHYACYSGSSEKLLLLIKNGARVTTKDSEDKTALHYACQNHNLSIDVVIALLKNGAHVNAVDKDGRTPMHYACINNNFPKTFALIQKNANRNIKDRYGKKPLQHASQDVIQYLNCSRTNATFCKGCTIA